MQVKAANQAKAERVLKHAADLRTKEARVKARMEAIAKVCLVWLPLKGYQGRTSDQWLSVYCKTGRSKSDSAGEGQEGRRAATAVARDLVASR